MEIRELQGEDLDALLGLYAYLHEDDVPLPQREHIEALWQEVVDNHCLSYLGAFEEGMLLSSCNLTIVPNLTRGCRPFALIENVVTVPDYRNRGYGKGVIREAIQRAKDAHCYKVMLYTSRKEESVHRFYMDLGFSSDTKTAYVMKL